MSLKFIHNTTLWEIRYQYGDDNSFTMCYISICEPGEEYGKYKRCTIHTGMARTAEEDMTSFSKEVGRKISLTRALEKCDKDFKEKAWNCYLKRVDFRKLNFKTKTKYSVTYHDDEPISLFQNVSNMWYWLTWNTKEVCRLLFS